MPYQQLSLDQVETAATGFKGPEGVVVDRAGNVYGGGTDGVIRKLAPDGTVAEYARTGGRPAGMALDQQGNLFVCDPVALRVSHERVEPASNSIKSFARRSMRAHWATTWRSGPPSA